MMNLNTAAMKQEMAGAEIHANLDQQDRMLMDAFYDAIQTRFLQQSAQYLELTRPQ